MTSHKHLYIIVAGLLSFATLNLYFIYINQNAVAQTETSNRFFEKDFCLDERQFLSGDTITYNNGQPVSSGISCFTSQIVVSDWDNIRTTDQNLITNRLVQQNGYIDVTPVNVTQTSGR